MEANDPAGADSAAADALLFYERVSTTAIGVSVPNLDMWETEPSDFQWVYGVNVQGVAQSGSESAYIIFRLSQRLWKFGVFSGGSSLSSRDEARARIIEIVAEIADVPVESVLKRLKEKSFARSVDRSYVTRGAEGILLSSIPPLVTPWFTVKFLGKVPFFYLPYMLWPVKRERAPGLLFPEFGQSWWIA